MLFYLLIALPAVPLLSFLISTMLDVAGGRAVEHMLLSALLCVPLSTTVLPIWFQHAEDLSTIEYQSLNIDIYEGHVASLNKQLNSFKYPNASLLNADTPVASVVKSLTEAQSKLAKAKIERADVIQKVEARRLGPVSGVISFVGDYK
jgi:hypothetical protein